MAIFSTLEVVPLDNYCSAEVPSEFAVILRIALVVLSPMWKTLIFNRLLPLEYSAFCIHAEEVEELVPSLVPKIIAEAFVLSGQFSEDLAISVFWRTN